MSRVVGLPRGGGTAAALSTSGQSDGQQIHQILTKRARILFYGTAFLAEVYQEAGYVMTSVDIDPKWSPTHFVDVLKWDYYDIYPPVYFTTIASRPPCTEYSTANTVGARDLHLADILVLKALETIDFLSPPSGGWRNPPRNSEEMPFHAMCPFCGRDYCQYSL